MTSSLLNSHSKRRMRWLQYLDRNFRKHIYHRPKNMKYNWVTVRVRGEDTGGKGMKKC